MDLAFDSRNSKLSSRAVVLHGLPDLRLLVALANPLLLPFRHIEDSATSAGDLDLRVLMISTLVSGLILRMLTEAMLSIN